MKTKIEINGIEVEVEFKDDSLSISVEKDGETIEDLMIPFSEEKEEESEEESEEEGDIKPFNDFEEEGDFEEESEEEVVETEEESEDNDEDNDEGIETFESFLNKK
jgi:hypothetical protein